MTRTLSLAALAATAALALVPTALGQNGPDAFERAVNAKVATSTVSIYPDAFQRAVTAEIRTRAAMYPDAFQRALGNRISASPSSIPGDHHQRLESFAAPASISASTSDTGVEWPQVGVGFALGALLGLGLMVTVRFMRARELAH